MAQKITSQNQMIVYSGPTMPYEEPTMPYEKPTIKGLHMFGHTDSKIEKIAQTEEPSINFETCALEEILSEGCRSTYTYFRKDHPMMTSPKCKETLAKVSRTQEVLLGQKGVAKELFPSAEIDVNLLVVENCFYVLGKSVGEGAQSTVELATKYATDMLSSPVEKKVIKKGNQSLSIEEKVLKENLPLNIYQDQRLNTPQNIYQLNYRNYAGVYEPCTGDLSHIDYTKVDLPATFIGKILMDISEGLKLVAEYGMSHRDIKGRNLLYSENRGVVGDFGLVQKASETPKNTNLTPPYGAPFIWKDILGQKYRNNGIQNEAADVFALGMTIQFDIFRLMLGQLGKHYGLDMGTFLNKTAYKIQSRWVSDGELQLLEKEAQSNGYCLIHSGHHLDPKLIHFVNREDALAATKDAINLLKGNLDEDELGKMHFLAQLAHDLRPTEPEGLNFKDVAEKLCKLFSPEEPSANLKREGDNLEMSDRNFKKQKFLTG